MPETEPNHRSARPLSVLIAVLLAATPALADDPFHSMQKESIRTRDIKVARPYHFGPQGGGSIYSTSLSHSNRLIPVYVFGKKADLGAVSGKNSVYRDKDRLTKLYGTLPPNTLNPDAEYFDQSDLYRVQEDAVAKGAKHLFIVWFDGMDWDTTRAAAIAKTGKTYGEGKGSGLNFQDYTAGGSAQFGYVVTSPTHDQSVRDPDAQTVKIDLAKSLPGGYDVRFGGPNPWTPGELLKKVPAYLQGEYASRAARDEAARLGGTIHAVTDSSTSAGEFATGVKSFNDGVNVADDGRFVETLFAKLQREQGWKVGTVTSVPFDHASPAAMYAHNVERDDYQDLAREMLGLESIVQKDGKGPRLPGLDVVMGAGYGQVLADSHLKGQGKNAFKDQNLYIADADLKAIDVKNGGKYVVVTTKLDVEGEESLARAADTAAKGDNRLFGLFGTNVSHLPYRTADDDYRPTVGILGTRESYSVDDLFENPTLADMTHAALKVLGAKPDRKFALFVEAGDVDFALHDNNLDNAIGAVYSGDVAVRVIIDWVEKNSNWDDSVLIVTADHGHYLVIDDPKALAGAATGNLAGWGTLIDPLHDCQARISGDSLTITVPGKLHDFNPPPSNFDAPRVLQEVKGDFTADIQVPEEPRPGGKRMGASLPFHGAGLVVSIDDDNFVRLERAGILREGEVVGYGLFEGRNRGQMFGRNDFMPPGATWLRLERKGETLSAFAGTDGQKWTPLASEKVSWPAAVKVGVMAVNSTDQLYAARFRGLKITQP